MVWPALIVRGQFMSFMVFVSSSLPRCESTNHIFIWISFKLSALLHVVGYHQQYLQTQAIPLHALAVRSRNTDQCIGRLVKP